LGDDLDTEQISARYEVRVLTLKILGAEKAGKPRKISIAHRENE
jgi:HSP20 family molecular chaperone IbpA